MKPLGMLFLMLATGTPLLGQAPGSITIDTAIDRMNGRPTAWVTWAAIDSVHSRYAYLPLLWARCSPDGKIGVYLTGVPVKNKMRRDLLGVETIEDVRVEVKLDGWDRSKGSKEGDFTEQNDAIWYFNGKRGITNLLLPTDTLLLRFPTLFGDVVLTEFHLGSVSTRRAALEHVADACGWTLPEQKENQ